jgi:hypothetical protein
MTANDQRRTLLTAVEYGGSFMRAIANAGLHADPDNRQRIFIAFPELVTCFGPQTMLYQRLHGCQR